MVIIFVPENPDKNDGIMMVSKQDDNFLVLYRVVKSSLAFATPSIRADSMVATGPHLQQLNIQLDPCIVVASETVARGAQGGTGFS